MQRRFEIPGDAVFPEGITEGPGTTFFLGSMTDGTIYRGDTATGKVEVFMPPDGDGRGVICGMDIDDYGRLISCDYEGGQLFAHDLASRTLVARRETPAGSGPNDVVVVGDTAFVTDSKSQVVWQLPAGPGEIGEPEIAVDLSGHYQGAPGAYLNGIVAHPGGTQLLVAAQGDGSLWRIDLATMSAARVDLGGYKFNADGLLLDDDVLYGVTNRGEDWADVRFMISALRLDPGWQSGTVLGELTDPDWDSPTTIAAVDGQLLVLCAQLRATHLNTPPSLPFVVAAMDMPRWKGGEGDGLE